MKSLTFYHINTNSLLGNFKTNFMIFGKKQNTIRINWYEVDYLNLRFAPDTDLYAISQGNLLFYLGKAYEQLVATRVVQLTQIETIN